MIKIILYSAGFLLLLPLSIDGAEIAGPDVRLTPDEIIVSAGLTIGEKNLDDLKNGIAKELIFNIDLFRIWKSWPDEFISGKKLVKTMRSDPVKKENVATSFDGSTFIEKRFKSIDSMITWTLNIKDLKLLNIKELEPAEYFVRITVESRLRKLPPLIGYMLFFIPEKDFRAAKDSRKFTVGEPR